jgi:hypothetical protein
MCRVRVVEEREDKFEVDPAWVMPQLTGLVPDGGRLDQEVRRLDNTYFDTARSRLRLFGVTLRRRVGGSETGWQLKVPNGTARTELQSGSRRKILPPPLAKAVVGLRACERLDPVVIADRRYDVGWLHCCGCVDASPASALAFRWALNQGGLTGAAVEAVRSIET